MINKQTPYAFYAQFRCGFCSYCLLYRTSLLDYTYVPSMTNIFSRFYAIGLHVLLFKIQDHSCSPVVYLLIVFLHLLERPGVQKGENSNINPYNRRIICTRQIKIIAIGLL